MSQPKGDMPSVDQSREDAHRQTLALALLAAVAVGLWWATPMLIVPYKAEQAWYESAATFPRLALLIVALCGVIEAGRRWRGTANSVTDELDSSAASLPRMAAALALFAGYVLAVPVLGFGVSSALFLASTGRAVGLSWRAALALSLPMAMVLWWVFVRLLRVAFGHGLLF